jgi:hypothetical protein
MESCATGGIPFDERVIFICFLHRAQFSCRLSEGSEAFNAISLAEFLAAGRRFDQSRPPGTV